MYPRRWLEHLAMFPSVFRHKWWSSNRTQATRIGPTNGTFMLCCHDDFRSLFTSQNQSRWINQSPVLPRTCTKQYELLSSSSCHLQKWHEFCIGDMMLSLDAGDVTQTRVIRQWQCTLNFGPQRPRFWFIGPKARHRASLSSKWWSFLISIWTFRIPMKNSSVTWQSVERAVQITRLIYMTDDIVKSEFLSDPILHHHVAL